MKAAEHWRMDQPGKAMKAVVGELDAMELDSVAQLGQLKRKLQVQNPPVDPRLPYTFEGQEARGRAEAAYTPLEEVAVGHILEVLRQGCTRTGSAAGPGCMPHEVLRLVVDDLEHPVAMRAARHAAYMLRAGANMPESWQEFVRASYQVPFKKVIARPPMPAADMRDIVKVLPGGVMPQLLPVGLFAAHSQQQGDSLAVGGVRGGE